MTNPMPVILVVPLAMLGTAVIVGILASAMIALLFVPVYNVLMVRLSRWVGRNKREKKTAE